MTQRLQPPQPCPRLVATENIITVTRNHIDSLHTVRNEIVRNVKIEDATFEDVVRPLANAQHATENSSGMIAVLGYASPEASARKAAEEARNLWNKAFSEFSDRHDVYVLLQAVKDRNETLDAESAKYLDELLADFIRCGHGRLTPEGVLEYVTRRNTIDKLRSEFTRNVRNASGGIWFSETELEGVLEQDLSRFRIAGEAQMEKPIDISKTSFVTLSKHDVTAVLQYAKDPDVRRRAYIANHSKLTENLPIFKEVISLRDTNARQLGYKSHAAYRLEKRLAKTTGWVYDFMDKLEEVLLPEGAKEVDKLLALRASHTSEHECEGNAIKTIPAWDYPYWKRLSLEAIFIDQDKIAEYFPIKEVVPRMLDLFSDCLRMRFIKMTFPAVWDPKVEAWEAWDNRSGREQEFIGYLYMDLEFRENKHRGCQNVNLQPSYIDRNGERRYPATVLMCNFPPFTPVGSPSCILLKHSQIVSLFHELGHGIHDLVSRTQYSRFHGWRSPPDYAEALSIMLENWCWLGDELKQLSCHYTASDPTLLQEWQTRHPGQEQPPTTIPSSLVDPLVQNRHAFRALYMLGQLADSRFDMAVHDLQSPEACFALDPPSLYLDFHERLTFLSNPASDRGHPHADFTHLFAGYDAGYYSYLSAQVFAADIFTQFVDDPRNRETWERYRSKVLERGAGMDEMQNLRDFLGREPDAGALFRVQQD